MVSIFNGFYLSNDIYFILFSEIKVLFIAVETAGPDLSCTLPGAEGSFALRSAPGIPGGLSVVVSLALSSLAFSP